MKKYMFDTNIYNHILNGSIDIEKLFGKVEFLVTHIQFDELNNTKDEIRKKDLLSLFININTSEIPTESAVWDVSRFGQCKWPTSDNLYEPIKKKLDKLNNNKPNNIQDALIAETTIINNITLVTHDSDLFKVATSFKCACANLYQVFKVIE